MVGDEERELVVVRSGERTAATADHHHREDSCLAPLDLGALGEFSDFIFSCLSISVQCSSRHHGMSYWVHGWQYDRNIRRSQ